MNEKQYDFYDGEPPHQPHSPTSKAAATNIKGSATTLRAKVLAFIEQHNGATDIEVQAGLEMDPSTQRPRRRELQLAGRVKDSGQKRKTPSGRSAVVWVKVDG